MKFNSELKVKNYSGVYLISSTVDNRTYIGSTKNFWQRYADHKSELSKGTHANPYLQNFVKKYGIDVLLFNIICICSEDLVKYNEMKLMELLRPEFNSKQLLFAAEMLPMDEKEMFNDARRIMDEILKDV